jgi:hypothetical protein
MPEIYTEYEAAVEWYQGYYGGYLYAYPMSAQLRREIENWKISPAHTGGRPQDDVTPIVELIREMQIEAVRNRPTGVVLPSSNAVYREARARWGHGPNRVKVRRAFKQLGSQY